MPSATGPPPSASWTTDLPLLAVVLSYATLVPFTKVEESFNMQATHDILYHGTDLAAYDHLEFPGVVPRSFLGALGLASLTSPVAAVAWALGLPKLVAQFAMRNVLGGVLWYSFRQFRIAVSERFGNDAGQWLVLVTCTQFHLPFYMSRTLPNVFALAVVLWAFRFWVERRYPALVMGLVGATVIFRCDVVVLLCPLLLMLLLLRQISILDSIKYGAISGFSTLGEFVIYYFRPQAWE